MLMQTHDQSPPPQRDRRTRQRFPFFREVNVVAAGQMIGAPSCDLSSDGIRIHLPLVLQPRADLALLLPILGQGSTTGVSPVGGEVVWQRHRWCGVRFVDPPEAFVRALDEVLSQYLLHASSREVAAFLRRR